MKLVKVAAAVSLCSLVFATGNLSAASQTPDKVMMQISKALQNNHPEVVFKALPASYQKDINSLVSDAAKRMDAEVWKAGNDVLKSALKVAKTKKDLLLQSQMLANNPKKDEISKNWNSAVKMVSTLVNSDFTNLQKLRAADMEKMLASSGAAIMRQATSMQSASEIKVKLDKLKSMKATLISQKGDSAKIKVTAEGEEPKEVEFVRVEGKWIPKNMADEFSESIKSAHEGLAKLDFSNENGQKLKKQLLQQFSMAKSMLEQAEKAESKEQLDGILMGMMMSIMMSSQNGAGAPPPGLPSN
jgi:hypothetical protein